MFERKVQGNLPNLGLKSYYTIKLEVTTYQELSQLHSLTHSFIHSFTAYRKPQFATPCGLGGEEVNSTSLPSWSPLSRRETDNEQLSDGYSNTQRQACAVV